jgi:signal transduction histidine kinase
MSHELRTPLNGILGFAQILEMNALQGQPGACVTHILKAGRHLLSLINEVLDLSGIEAGRVTFSIEPVRLLDAAREALDLVRPLATPRGCGWSSPRKRSSMPGCGRSPAAPTGAFEPARECGEIQPRGRRSDALVGGEHLRTACASWSATLARRCTGESRTALCAL